MFRPPDHNHNLSMRLSAVLHDIGVTETLVKKRRRTSMISEVIANIGYFLADCDIKIHEFGSQSESSSTDGLNSDFDELKYHPKRHVIQDLSQWEPNRYCQYLMVQDQTTSPGYCLLQLLRNDAPLPAVNIQSKYLITDRIGRVFLRNSYDCGCIMNFGGIPKRVSINGPARSSKCGVPTCQNEFDKVSAFHCQSWPREAGPWLHQQNVSGWPTEDMKRYSAQQGCFTVPVGSKTGINQDLEWRISTSLAERCLMYNINITQIRCYILMKMIIQTFLKPKCGKAITSFMCKNILFYCIAGSAASSTWNESSLLTRLNQCLQSLFHCILTGNCPHFVIPMNNLLAGKLSPEVKTKLAEVMCTLTANIEKTLMRIQIDNLGNRLRAKSGHILSEHDLSDYNDAYEVQSRINDIAQRLLDALGSIQRYKFQNVDANDQIPSQLVSKLCQLYALGSQIEKFAINFLTPFLCTIIGSIKASATIHHTRAISSEALRWFSLGLNSDFSSSRLKLASALYCAGDLVKCEIILTAVRRQLSQTTVLTRCSCHIRVTKLKADFAKLCYENNEDVIKHNMTFCVKYLHSEFNCIPRELVYEMFRTTEEDRPYRTPNDDFWMDNAVVDSLPYLFFLQYNVYSQLQRPEDQARALYNLATTINTEINLGHRETALNLLGQCMVQEGRHQEALYCYVTSLKIRRRNNAAKWHLCMLLARLIHRPEN